MKMSAWLPFVYFVLGQAAWFACVLSAAHGVPVVGSIVVAIMLVAHLCVVPRPREECKLLAFVLLIAAIWESAMVQFRLLSYPSGMLIPGVAPYWILALWLSFGAQFNTTYNWLKVRPALAALLGAIAGPVSFRAGVSLGALRFEQPVPALVVLAAGWAVILPLLIIASRRWDGVRSASLLGVALLALGAAPAAVFAEPIKVLHPQGSAHGFVDVETLDGKRIAVGDLIQRAHGSTVSSRLVLHFFDGSLDDETTVYSERGVFRFISDHHVQRGPAFPKPIDIKIDAGKGSVTSVDASGKVKQSHIDMPADIYNGLASSMLMNLPPAVAAIKIAIVVGTGTPRIAHLAAKKAGEVPFTLGGVARSAIDYQVHVELGGVAGVVAPIIGKEPSDYHVLILGGEDPAFIREEGQLYEGGPVWRIQQISAEFPNN